MAFYEDLSPYNYTHYCEKELNIGWLQKDKDFPVGDTPEGFLERLKWFAEKPFPMFHAGHHLCEFCEDKNANSSCELRIVGADDTVYACPILIIHYIEVHKYLPPQQFIDAVMNGPRPGQDKYTDAVYKSVVPFWEQRRPDPNDEDFEDKMRELMTRNLSEEVDSKLINDLLNQYPDFKKFVESYGKVMPAVYGMKNKNEKSE
jgi:hypothetical protein